MPRSPARPREVFLSHSSRDRAFAAALSETLVRHGVPVWYSPTSLQGAQEWHDEIGRALARCDWFVVVLSRAAIKSDWVERELVYPLAKKRYGRRIVPLLLEPCRFERLSWTLGGVQYIDFTTDVRAGCRDLLRIWGIGFDATLCALRKRPGGSRGRRRNQARKRG